MAALLRIRPSLEKLSLWESRNASEKGLWVWPTKPTRNEPLLSLKCFGEGALGVAYQTDPK